MDGQTEQTQETVVTRTTYMDNVRGIWRDFGPLLVGLLVLIVVLAGGWYLWKNRIQPAGQDVTFEETVDDVSYNNLPEAELFLEPTTSPKPSPTPATAAGTATATPAPTPAASASPSASPKGKELAQGSTKGGELPKTGIPFAIPVLFAISALGGVLVRRLSR